MRPMLGKWFVFVGVGYAKAPPVRTVFAQAYLKWLGIPMRRASSALRIAFLWENRNFLWWWIVGKGALNPFKIKSKKQP